MRKLLNTVYITNEQMYLTLDGENLVCKLDGLEKLRIPFDNVENITCFSYIGCSPALMGKCVSKQIPINFVSPQGRFLAKVCGETKGNVFLRVAQIKNYEQNGLELAKNTIAAKLYNTQKLIKRSLHDNSRLRSDEEILTTLDILSQGIEKILYARNIAEIVGIEGYCAKEYFSIFNKLFSNNIEVEFHQRTKRPPLDPINATLSFLYTLATNDYASSLETVGLDSYIGYCHTLRSGRNSLACDLVEEIRCLIERFTITLFNLQIITRKDFNQQVSGAIWLNDEGRKKVITKWQEKKRSCLVHPFLKEKIPYGLIPYVQSNLLAKYIRGELKTYPAFLLKN